MFNSQTRPIESHQTVTEPLNSFRMERISQSDFHGALNP